jgi:AcrR family transcriptional regulator
MQQRGQETRGLLLETAWTRFAKNGYDATGVAEICEAAGVSKGAFYYHFESKRDLFQALLENWLSDIERALREVTAVAASVPERLLIMAQRVGEMLATEPERVPMFLEFWTQAGRDPEIHAAIIAPYRNFQAFFEAQIREGIAAGTLSSVDPEVAAQALISLASGLFLQHLLDPDSVDWSTATEERVRVLLEGLQRR